MSSVYIYMYSEGANDTILDHFAGLEDVREEHPEIKATELTSRDLNTLVYILEMDISHMETELRQHPDREPVKRILESETRLLNKFKGFMD